MDWLLYEKEAISKGHANVCGVDEAGRGPLSPVMRAHVCKSSAAKRRACAGKSRFWVGNSGAPHINSACLPGGQAK